MATPFRHIHHEEWVVSCGAADSYRTDHGDKATAEREAAIMRTNATDAHPVRKRVCLWTDPYAEGFVRGVDSKPLAETIRPPAEDLKAIALTLRLVAFVDQEHETIGGGCWPEPGKDCVPHCEACKVLGDVPADLLALVREEAAQGGAS
jgi:hypothetical protein